VRLFLFAFLLFRVELCFGSRNEVYFLYAWFPCDLPTADSYVCLRISLLSQILLQSDNYITRRRSLKLLAEILLDRSNYSVMMCYISNKGNLKVRFVLLIVSLPLVDILSWQ
jgi:hypothetical protein